MAQRRVDPLRNVQGGTPTPSEAKGFPYSPDRVLGQTGLPVTSISFGAFKIGRNQKIKYAQGYELPGDIEVERLLNGVLDLGIRLIDTAPAYGMSEQRIGRHLAHRRREYLLSTKVGETFEACPGLRSGDEQSRYDFSREAILRSIHRSLEHLRTDLLDLVFIHSDGNDLQILTQTDAVPTLQQLRDQGLIRYLGLSGKTVAGARAALRWADALMIEYHLHDTSHEEVIAEAGAAGVAVLVKKPLASGTIPPAVAIPFLLRHPHISTLVVGGLNLEHLRQNLEIAQQVCAGGL